MVYHDPTRSLPFRRRVQYKAEYWFRKAWFDLKKTLGVRLTSDKNHVVERIVAGLARGAISRAVILTVTEREDGFGSQLLCRLSTYALANYLGLGFTHTPFRNVAHAEGDAAQWTRRCETIVNLGATTDLIPSPQTTINLLDFIKNKSYWKQNTTIQIHNAYIFCDRFPFIYEKYMEIARQHIFKEDFIRSNTVLNVVIHIRRGDITPTYDRHRYTRNDEIQNTLGSLRSTLKSSGMPYRIEVHSNASATELALFAADDVTLCLDLSALESFLRMAQADILVTAKSSFSFAAALYSNGIVVYEKFDRSPLDKWIRKSADGTVPQRDILDAIATCVRRKTAERLQSDHSHPEAQRAQSHHQATGADV